MLSPRKGKMYSLELLAVDSRFDLRSEGKSFLRSTDANSIGSLLTVIQENLLFRYYFVISKIRQ